MNDTIQTPLGGRPASARLKALFGSSSDVKFEMYQIGPADPGVQVLFVYCQELTDGRTAIYHMVLPGLEQLYAKTGFADEKRILTDSPLELHKLPQAFSDQEAGDVLFQGSLLLVFPGIETVFWVDIASIPGRQPEESNIEVSVRGPKDGFVESIYTNVALVRKRLRTPALSLEEFVLGRRTRTKVALMYMDGLTKPHFVEEARRRLQRIDMDGIFSSTQLEELIQDQPKTFFPLCDLTGRPDFAVQAILAGRLLVFVDGNPSVIIAPASLTQLLKSPEDSHFTYLSVSFGSVLRFLSMFISLLLPGFYIAITTYHPDQLPFTLLATLTVTRLGTPFSAPLEMLLTLMLLEIFREAGVRLPSAIGQTLTVVGGLIIGDAAIRAGLISPSMVVVAALTAVAGSTLVSQALAATLTVVRFGILLVSSFLGMYGFLLAAILLAVYMASLTSLGMPFLSPLSPPSRETVISLLRLPWVMNKYRPASLDPQDMTKQGGDSQWQKE
ncbi:spore germination protein [Paenibacillus sp. J31TS4]|uniref:spore germination protein n=1 Tax=Paenibacillus sp. J31TS4 TaxID=2807195 RepID=UPI001B0E84E9|nr:spore germination protein [Paenibacillus sp. J31TS4]GIP37222.1 spore germination protein [Paenibacillus sp. J31TS4]